ncbi:MAG: sigma-70 family RNA polymerase sigma factor [Planctomycetota bacterium]|nr:sigma-70 family RNA polymerase sigma factor [Planctomycetota bacterium]
MPPQPTASRPASPPDRAPALLARAARGDESAWRELVDLYWRRVYALSVSRCRDDDLAEEITQSVFVTLAEQLTADAYTEKGRFEPWLFRIAMNRLRDEMRRRRRRPQASLESADLPVAASANSADIEDDLAALRVALDSLSEADREIIELRHHAELPFKEIAQMLQEPVGTLLARHHRALAKLRDILARTEGARS